MHPNEKDIWQQIDSLVLSQKAMDIELTLYVEISSDNITSTELWKAINERFERHSKLVFATAYTKLSVMNKCRMGRFVNLGLNTSTLVESSPANNSMPSSLPFLILIPNGGNLIYVPIALKILKG